MSNYTVGNVGKEMGSVPFGSLLSGIATGIAEGQWALDKSSIRVSELMSGQRLLRDIDTGKLLTVNGNDLPAGSEPHMVDSRVLFGYDYINEDAQAADFKVSITAGAISSINIPAGKGGKDYAFAPLAEIIGDGTGASIRALLEDGVIKNIAVDNGGSGYTSAKVSVTGGGGRRVPRKLSMMELGFTPNFYQFVDTIIEIKIIIKMVESTEESRKETPRTVTTNQKSTEYSSQGYGWSWWRPHSSSYKRKETSVVTKTVDPAYSNKYNYSIEGSSLVRTKLVPVPPPTILEERIRQLMETEEIFRNAQLKSGNL